MFTLVVANIFITGLVVTTKIPSQGWLQWTQPFHTIERCHNVVRSNYFQIESDINVALKGTLIKVMEIRCMTRREAVGRNTEFGH